MSASVTPKVSLIVYDGYTGQKIILYLHPQLVVQVNTSHTKTSAVWSV